MKNIAKYAFLNSFAVILYIVAVVNFLFYVPKYLGVDESIFIPILMLMLFVFSAALTSALVLGRPLLWFFEGKKREAIFLFVSTLLSFFVMIVVTFLIFFFIPK